MRGNARESFFPELDGDEQREADEWLRDYLRLIMRLQRERMERGQPTGCPQPGD